MSTPTLKEQLNSLSVFHLLIVIVVIRALETPVLGKIILAVWKV